MLQPVLCELCVRRHAEIVESRGWERFWRRYGLFYLMSICDLAICCGCFSLIWSHGTGNTEHMEMKPLHPMWRSQNAAGFLQCERSWGVLSVMPFISRFYLMLATQQLKLCLWFVFDSSRDLHSSISSLWVSPNQNTRELAALCLPGRICSEASPGAQKSFAVIVWRLPSCSRVGLSPSAELTVSLKQTLKYNPLYLFKALCSLHQTSIKL